MGSLRDYSTKLKNTKEENLDKGILKVIDDYKHVAIDLNTSQLMAGEDSTGKMLDPYRSPSYASLKLFLNPRGVTDLRLTGAFQESFFIKDSKFPISFSATDEKTSELINRYGDQIFGLNEESISTLNQNILPGIQEFFKKLVSV